MFNSHLRPAIGSSRANVSSYERSKDWSYLPAHFGVFNRNRDDPRSWRFVVRDQAQSLPSSLSMAAIESILVFNEVYRTFKLSQRSVSDRSYFLIQLKQTAWW